MNSNNNNDNRYIFDIEVYPNYFLAVFKNLSAEKKDFVIIDIKDTDNGDLAAFLATKPRLIGYNNVGYDAQILEFILKNPGTNVHAIKAFNDQLIDSKWPIFREWELSTNNLDLMVINNYGMMSAKATSLKKIEFFLREKSIKDTPHSFFKAIKPSAIPDIIKYCKNDVLVTEKFFNEVSGLIPVRENLSKELKTNALNTTEPGMARVYMTKKLSKLSGITEAKFKKGRTYRTSINVEDIILPYVDFKTKAYDKVLDFFKDVKLKESKQRDGSMLLTLKGAIEYKTDIHGSQYVFGVGGLHQATDAGVYENNDDYVIYDWDVKSFYPNLAIRNKFKPKHLDQNFLDFYEGMYNDRVTKFPKKTHPHENYLIKIILNSIYGLSNSKYSPFYDPEYTAQTCINGQLTLLMLIEDFVESIPDCQILQTNTDGVSIRFPKKYLTTMYEVTTRFEKTTKLELEHEEYNMMAIVDVNNYLCRTVAGEVKAKGLFETYEDMVAANAFHKNPSNNIVPIALREVLLNNGSLNKVVDECNDIFEFCAGVKGKSNFNWVISHVETVNGNPMVRNKSFNTRMVRYFMGGDYTLSKLWIKGARIGSFTSVEADVNITLAQYVRRQDIVRNEVDAFPQLDREWYKDKIKSVLDTLGML